MRYRYDSSFDPPAAVLPVRVRAPGNEAAVLLPVLVDTGADLCVVPAYLVDELGLIPVSRAQVCGFDGVFRSALLYAATLEVEGTSTICEVLASGDQALAGRDFLNRLTLLLEGPRRNLVMKK